MRNRSAESSRTGRGICRAKPLENRNGFVLFLYFCHMMSLGLRIICAFAALLACTRAAAGTPESGYPVNGRVIDRLTRRPVAYAAVVPVGQEQRGVSTDSAVRAGA